MLSLDKPGSFATPDATMPPLNWQEVRMKKGFSSSQLWFCCQEKGEEERC